LVTRLVPSAAIAAFASGLFVLPSTASMERFMQRLRAAFW
jgi:hypothetical protein